MKTVAWTLLAAVMLGGCGTPLPSTPDPVPVPVPDTPKPPETTLTGNVSAYGVRSHEVELAQDGTLIATLTWSGPIDLDLYLTAPGCSGYPPDACVILVRSTASAGNSERVEWPGKQKERVVLWVDNFSPSQAVDYAIVTTIR